MVAGLAPAGQWSRSSGSEPDARRLLVIGVTENAQVLVGDVLLPSGALRTERAATTKGCRQRCVFITHRRRGSAFALTVKPRLLVDVTVGDY